MRWNLHERNHIVKPTEYGSYRMTSRMRESNPMADWGPAAVSEDASYCVSEDASY
jgi:hypothetical protein